MSIARVVSDERLERLCLPDLSIKDVHNLKQEGFARIGRAFALITVDGLLLSGLHRDDGRNGHPKKGLVGPISETVAGRFDDQGKLVSVERMRQTFARCTFEELGVKPDSLPLFFGHNRQAPTTIWPLNTSRSLVAQTGVLFFDKDFDHERFAETFTPTLELERVAFLGVDEFLNQRLRAGAKEWIEQLDAHGFLRPQVDLVKADVPGPYPDPFSIDLRLDSMPLL